MLRPRVLACFIALSLVGMGGSSAFADHVLYSFSGVGSGELGGVGFTDAAFTFSVIGDTANMVPDGLGPDSTVLFDLTTTVEIDGFSAATVNELSYVFVNRATPAVGLGDFSVGDYLNLGDASLTTYFLDAPFGPVTAPITYFNVALLQTDAGGLNLTSTGDATFTASVSAVPEPSTLISGGIAGLGMIGLAWRRRKRA